MSSIFCRLEKDQLVALSKGLKSVELRLHNGLWQDVQVGSEICFGEVQCHLDENVKTEMSNPTTRKLSKVSRIVKNVEIFDSFKQAISVIGADKIAPGVCFSEVLAWYNSLYMQESYYKYFDIKIAAYHM